MAHVLEGQSHTSPPSQQQHHHHDFFHARLLTPDAHLVHALGNTLASSDDLRVAVGTYLAAEVHLVNSTPAAPPPVLLRVHPNRQSYQVAVLFSSPVQPCLVFPFLFVRFLNVSGCWMNGRRGGWRRQIVEHVPALRVQPMLAPLTPLTRGYRTGPPRHECLRKPLQGRRYNSDCTVGRRSGQPLQRLGPLVYATPTGARALAPAARSRTVKDRRLIDNPASYMTCVDNATESCRPGPSG